MMMDYDDIGLGPEPETSLVPMLLDPEPGDYEPDEDDDNDNPTGEWSNPGEADVSGAPLLIHDDEDVRMVAKVASDVETTATLRNLGWRIRTTGERSQAIRNFQRAWNLGHALTVDSIVGPLTTSALRLSEARRRRGLPTASAHFSFVEYACKCGGKYSNCARIWTARAPIAEDERYRAALGHGFGIVSGCRCTGHNHDVGGVPHSRHLLGDARDFPDEEVPSWFTARKIYHGHGYNLSTGKVCHGDLGAPRIWIYKR